MNVALEAEQADGGTVFGGAFIWSHSMATFFMGTDFKLLDGSHHFDYIDENGYEQTLYVVRATNGQMLKDFVDETQPDVFQTPPAQVSGSLVEYLGTSASRTTTAMTTVERQAGLTATAAADQCAELTNTTILKEAIYGWMDDAWVAGTINFDYINHYDLETRNTYDLNDDGVASDNATAVFYVHNAYGDFSWLDAYQGYLWDGTFNDEGSNYVNIEYYIPTNAIDLSDNNTWQHDGSYTQPTVRYVSDLDGGGTIEKYEGSADSPIYGEVRNGSYDVTVCVSPIRLGGEGLNIHVDNFRAGDPIVLNTGRSGTDVEVQ